AFQADAQFQQHQHVAHRGDIGRVDAEIGAAAGLERIGADAVVRLDQAGGLQARQGLAHYRAADPELAHERRFGGQLFAGPDLPATDARGEILDQPLRQVARTARRGNRRFWGIGHRGISRVAPRLTAKFWRHYTARRLYDNLAKTRRSIFPNLL